MGTARLRIGLHTLKYALGLPDNTEIEFVSIRTLGVESDEQEGKFYSIFSIKGNASAQLELQINHPSINENSGVIPDVFVSVETILTQRFSKFVVSERQE